MPVKKYNKPNKTIQCIRMLKILKAKKYVKKKEIAYLLGEQTDRNINNYKNTLYDAGYPINYKPGKNGGYFLEYDSILPANKLNNLELKSLSVTYDYLMKETNLPNKNILLEYISNAFLEREKVVNNEELSLFGHFPLAMSSDEIERRYYIINTAIDLKRKVKILYKGYNKDNERIIHPLKLFKFTNWIVFGKDDKQISQTRYNSFKLHRIKEIELLNETFEIDNDYDEEDYFDQSGIKGEIIPVTLKIYGRIGRTLDEKVYGQNQVVKCLDSKKHIYLFKADMRNALVVRKFILSFGPICEVIEPAFLRNMTIKDAEKTIDNYKKYQKKEKIYISEQSLCKVKGYDEAINSEKGSNHMKIKGLYSEAIVYTDIIEENSINQIEELCNLEVFKGSKIRIMPDVHAGKGCVIGFTADLGDKVIPNIVGVDIGCGMYTVKLGKIDINLEKLDQFITTSIPNGKAINMHKQAEYLEELKKLKLLNDVRHDLKKWNRAIGSLGGGNHFIEVNEDEKGNKYLVIHSGSRNLGHVVASHYQKKAVEFHSGFNNEYLEKRNQLIKDYKAEGRRKEIQSGLLKLKESYQVDLDIPEHLCYLEGELRDEYLHDMEICQRFASLNREVIAIRILDFICGHHDFQGFQTIHNFIDFEDNIVRKGAIKAARNEELLIPINMRDGSILAVGKGNDEWNQSAPHGAGRMMSRTKAFEQIKFEEFKKEMEGIYSTSVTPKTVDESPMAYKSMNDILDYIGDTVEVKAILKPIYNFKSQH